MKHTMAGQVIKKELDQLARLQTLFLLIGPEVMNERIRQERLRIEGRFKHTCADPEVDEGYKLAVLMEEVGEVGRALMEKQGKIGDMHNKDLRKELIQVAAVAVAWVEALTTYES